MRKDLQDRFDRLLGDVIEGLPPHLRAMIDEVGVVVLDRPDCAIIDDLLRDGTIASAAEAAELCGLHVGTANTERSVSDVAPLPTVIYLFREGIVSLALDPPSEEDEAGDADAWRRWGADGRLTSDDDDAVYEEIRTTLLHELGHQFGMDEDDLDELGYG